MKLPSDRIGPYRLLRWIGSGGIGHVFAAVHEHMGQEVAVKVLSQAAAEDPQLVARFVQEARALAQLRHPGIVRVHNCEKLEDGTAYLAMEHLDGTTLRAWMRRREGPAPLDAALEIGRQIADAMIEVHAKDIVHRDLKPENVLLVPDQTAPLQHRTKVLDFGIAKVPAPADGERIDTQVQTGAPILLGTATYMAPEQCRNAAAVTDRADVYALGVMLFELLAGKPPFDSADPIELIAMHVRAEPRHLQDVVRAVPPGLSAFVASMLAKDPAQRPTMLRCRDMLARPWPEERHECPFPGLQPFTEVQAELFFGRKEETEALVALLDGMREEARVWLQIEGPSGAGKSSLVQAAVLPRLRSRPPEGKRRIVATLRPSHDPVGSLAEALSVACPERPLGGRADIEDALRRGPGALAGILERDGQADVEWLLVIEQLEEMFAFGATHLGHFEALLATALTAPGSSLRLLTTVRSDYIHRFDQTPRLAELLNSRASRYYLRPMREDALAQVIHGMATRAGLRLSEGLPDRMVRDAAGMDGRLPLLGHTMRSLWSSRGGAVLTHEHYEQIGGGSGALARHAELLMESLGEEGRERAKWLILDLVQVGRGVPDTRRTRTRQEVLAAAGGDQLAEHVLMRLSGIPVDAPANAPENLRLIVLSGDPPEGPALRRVDLVHETLLQRVPTIVAWIDAERTLLERHADLEVAAHAWEQAGCPAEGLPSGSLLDHYRGDAGDARRRDRLTRMASERARRFVQSAQRVASRRLRLRRGVIGGLVAGMTAILISALVAVQQRERAETNLQHMILATEQVVSDADWKLGRLLYTLEVRQKMLEHIDSNISSLPAQEHDDLHVSMAIVETKHRRSDLARLNESLHRADAFVAEARKQILLNLEGHATDRELQELLALNLSKRGKIAFARGRHDDARADLAESVAVLMRMGNDGSSNYRRTLATSYSEQADVELEAGSLSGATGLYDQAIRLLEQNEGNYDRSLLALGLNLRGSAARRDGDLTAAASHLDRALRIQELVVQAVPGNVFFQWILGRIHVELGALRADEGRPAEAARLYDAAITMGESMHLGDPTHKEYALLLCHGLQADEAFATAQGDHERARRARRRRCEVALDLARRDSDDARFQKLICP